ncbi:MAG: hypothetical protein HY598_04135 [Candidatus Omnitrophica bacterium]|nr:hypothetical protein [Candidatus Omnitrophota bacterium]
MELVVDTNVLVAGFLRSATTRELLLDERLILWAPEYLLTEAERILPTSAFRPKLPDAKALVADPEDAPFLALALYLQLPLWSNDAPLRTQHAVVVYTTENVLSVLQGRS